MLRFVAGSIALIRFGLGRFAGPFLYPSYSPHTISIASYFRYVYEPAAAAVVAEEEEGGGLHIKHLRFVVNIIEYLIQ